MEGKVFISTVVIIFTIQTSFCAITVVTPGIIEQYQDPFAGQNFFDDHDIDFTDEKPKNSIDERNSFASSWSSPSELHPHGSFSSSEKHESSSNQYDNGGPYDQNVEYAPRSINNNYRRSNKHRGCNRNNRRRRRRRGGNGHSNRGGHHDVGGRHVEGGSPQTGETTHGITAQAAVIGPGATISGVAVTVDH